MLYFYYYESLEKNIHELDELFRIYFMIEKIFNGNNIIHRVKTI